MPGSAVAIGVSVIGSATTLVAAAVAQVAVPGSAATVLTVGVITTVFVAGGGFFVTQREAKTAHLRISKFQEEQERENEKLGTKIDDLREKMGEQHVVVLAVIDSKLDALHGRLNAMKGFDRREHER